METGGSTRDTREFALEGERIPPDFRSIPLSWRFPCPPEFGLQSVEMGPFLSEEPESSGDDAGGEIDVGGGAGGLDGGVAGRRDQGGREQTRGGAALSVRPFGVGFGEAFAPVAIPGVAVAPLPADFG